MSSQGRMNEQRKKDVPRAPTSDDRPWETAEVAYFLGVSCGTVRNLERDGELPALPRIRGRVRFDPATVRKFRDTGSALAQHSSVGAQAIPFSQGNRARRGG
jgi:excisionase family DNA binding protein